MRANTGEALVVIVPAQYSPGHLIPREHHSVHLDRKAVLALRQETEKAAALLATVFAREDQRHV